MPFSLSFFIALRYWRSKQRDPFSRLMTKLGSIGIALGVMALIVVLSVMNGLEISQKVQRLSSLPHMIIEPTTGHFSLVDFPKQAEKLFTYREIKQVIPINQAQVLLQSSSALAMAQLIGIRRFQDVPQLKTFVEKGRHFTSLLAHKKFQLMISQRLAHQLNVHIGDKIRLTLTEHSQYTPIGQMPVQRVFTISGIYANSNTNSEEQVFSHLEDVGRLIHIPSQKVQGYRLFLKDPFQVEGLQQALAQPTWHIHDWREKQGEFFQAVKMEKNMMGLLISLIMLVAIANIFTSLSLMVLDKQREMAILRTMGMARYDVWQIFILQGGLVGLVGTSIGVGLGLVFSLNFEYILLFFAPQIYLPCVVDIPQIFIIAMSVMATTLLSTLYPAYCAGQISPVEALRNE